jgi:hypothetical protein
MKLLFMSLLVSGLCSLAASVQAAQDRAFYLARCTDEVSQKYGAGLDIKLVSLRRAGDAMRVKVAVRRESTADGVEKVQFMTCLVSRDTTQRGSDAEDVNSPPVTGEAAVSRGR